ncbi:hypothetical protein LZ30DRAFT_480134 [Colletotrichum cereale]|nr:hypothetical protein LZ30DRAFT_480134 [Colletotrichum cereale]
MKRRETSAFRSNRFPLKNRFIWLLRQGVSIIKCLRQWLLTSSPVRVARHCSIEFAKLSPKRPRTPLPPVSKDDATHARLQRNITSQAVMNDSPVSPEGPLEQTCSLFDQAVVSAQPQVELWTPLGAGKEGGRWLAYDPVSSFARTLSMSTIRLGTGSMMRLT